MAKLYSQDSPKKQIKMNPKKETVDFLLNYSKALIIIDYNKLKFETIIN